MTQNVPNVWDYFSFPDRSARDIYAERMNRISEINISLTELGLPDDFSEQLELEPLLVDFVSFINNKAFDSALSYQMFMHYYSKGLPDRHYSDAVVYQQEHPEYVIPSKEQYCYLHWFGYFADGFFIRMMAIWDLVLALLDEYLEYRLFRSDQSQSKGELIKRIKEEYPPIYFVLKDIYENKAYQDAFHFRNYAAHQYTLSNPRGLIKPHYEKGKLDQLTLTSGMFSKPVDIVHTADALIDLTAREIHHLLQVIRENVEPPYFDNSISELEPS